ncbi:hypothetical protein JAAARDRAFT_131413 [Jaapia argillacea MUCL 33604]|uniref:Mitochondrial carrier protein n=1 Tax=Jaapia argillacea MUCL 33604 TaxID=933084 RepID=A0A067Q0G7_9AGAM|nr:hypothetical protein JAAARDRAFT_131413 [Jaapia argillacea MUCL 33604]
MAAQSKPVQQLTPFGYALAGALGGCFSTAIVYPLDVVKTRIQADAKASEGHDLAISSVILRIFKDEGFWGFYRGFTATMLNTFSMQYAYFFFYSWVRNSYIKRLSRKLPVGAKAPTLSTAAELLLGALAGALAQICTLPVAVIATRQQVGRSLDTPKSRRLPTEPLTNGLADEESDEEYDDSFFGIAKEVVREEGIPGLWLGLMPGLVLTSNPAITYGVYERVKAAALKAKPTINGKLTPGMSFLVGALSKTLATVVTYPYIMAKVRIQARGADLETAEEDHLDRPHHNKPHHLKDHHPGALDILGRVYRKQGIFGWYQGMSAQIVKAVISQALLFMSKDQFEHWALAIMILLTKFRSR